MKKVGKWAVMVIVWLVLFWLIIAATGCQMVHGLGMDITDMSEPYVKGK